MRTLLFSHLNMSSLNTLEKYKKDMENLREIFSIQVAAPNCLGTDSIGWKMMLQNVRADTLSRETWRSAMNT